MVKVLFLVICTEEEPWHSIHEFGQKNTWLKDLGTNVDYLSVFSGGQLGSSHQDPNNHRRVIFPFDNPRCSLDQLNYDRQGSKFVVPTYRGYGGLVPSSLSAMKYALEQSDFDFIIRTNVSSYWNIPKLISELEKLPRANLYAGVNGLIDSGIKKRLLKRKYVSGAGMIMTPDVAAKFVASYHLFDLNVIDDVAFGMVANKLKIRTTNLGRLDILSLVQFNQTAQSDLRKAFHIRCKSYSEEISEKRDDIKIMKLIHESVI